MNLKRTFGAILTVLGIVGLIYAAYQFLVVGHHQWLPSLVVFVIGIIFFTSGIGLIKGTKDES